jgi:hypothetical protein
MTKEEAKELLPIITAYAEGKTIQIKDNYGNWHYPANPDFTKGPENYRIEPKLRYRPFDNMDECLTEMKNHLPYGWLERPETQYQERSQEIIVSLNDSYLYMNEYHSTYEDAFNNATFADGSPFGIKEE